MRFKLEITKDVDDWTDILKALTGAKKLFETEEFDMYREYPLVDRQGNKIGYFKVMN